MFTNTLTKTITIKASNMVYVKEKSFENFDILYIFEKIMKIAINNSIFENNQFSHFFKLLVNHPCTTSKMELNIQVIAISFFKICILRTLLEKLSVHYCYLKF